MKENFKPKTFSRQFIENCAASIASYESPAKEVIKYKIGKESPKESGESDNESKPDYGITYNSPRYDMNSYNDSQRL